MIKRKEISQPAFPRLLVIDDKQDNRILLMEYLHDLDLSIEEAACGSEGLDLMRENQYALVCLDVHMPGMDGFQVLETMKNDPLIADTPVIFISAVYYAEEHILRGIGLGAIDFMTKPINIAILRSKVMNVIRLYENQLKLDATVKKLGRMNQRLKENEQRFKRITQSASDAIIQLDQSFCIRYWNNAACRIFGYAKFEVASENFIEKILADDSRRIFGGEIHRLESQNNSVTGTIALKGISTRGIQIPLEISVSRFNTAEGQVNYTVIARDISQRLKMEKAAQKSRELRESNRVMKEFMDNVSHELRTPMNAITGISSMLMKYHGGNLSPKQLEGLKIIHQSGERLLDLVNDVLDLSRIESKKEQVRSELVNFEQLLASINSIALSLIGQKHLVFTVKKSDSVPERIISDSKKIQQILINLISNSVKFTPKGKIQLCIHLIGDNLYFEVADTGIGIAEKDRLKIFDRFQQIDNTASKLYKGTGLGLNIVKQLVSLMSGEIQVDSSPGKGTVMKFYIKVKKPGTAGQKQEIGSELRKTMWFDNYDPDQKLVLLIDYKEDRHFFIASLLGEQKYQVVSCYEARRAFNTIRQLRPDLIILNMEMPKIHGYTLLNRIRKSRDVSDTPILAYTSVDEMKMALKGLNIHILNDSLSEHSLFNALSKIKVKSRHIIEMNGLAFMEKGNLFFPEESEDSACYSVESGELAFLSLFRRKINNLMLVGLDMNGENIKLCRKLAQHRHLYHTLYIIYDQAFKSTLDELNNLLPDHKALTIPESSKLELFKNRTMIYREHI